jgi:asparagine N-glycosylation enzyme membrane subunit Stt3
LKKLIPIIAIVAVVIVVAALAVTFNSLPTRVDAIGGKYSSTVTHYTDHAQLTYTDETGQHSQNYFDDNFKPALNWIANSTEENATVLCWWDYGHMVKAVGQRDTVVRNPSQEILNSIADPSGIKEFDSNDKIVDVATALTTSNQSETVQIMQKYNAAYLLVCKDDGVKAVWFYRIAGLNNTDYISSDGSTFTFTDLGSKTMIARLLENRDTGLTLVYEDTQVKIYKLPET